MSKRVRVAIYARYSTDEQRPQSIDDQVALCRRRCVELGWEVVDVFADAALSGSNNQRPDYERLKEACDRNQIDVVMAEALDRLSRRQAEVMSFFDLLTFKRIRLFTLDHGEMTPLLAGILGTIAQSYIADLRSKTRRGMTGLVNSGLTPSGIGYGYKAVEGSPGERTIYEPEADVVRRIFAMYGGGTSPRIIAKCLNNEGVPGPNGRPWVDTTIRGQVSRGTGLLNNEAYIGELVWNRCSYVADPRTGKRVARPNPPEQWERKTTPHLRIVSDEQWERAKQQQREVFVEMARNEGGVALNRAHRKKYALSGSIMCEECGKPFAVSSARHYSCPTYRSKGTCTNHHRVDRQVLEASVVGALRDQILTVDTVREVIEAMMQDRRNQIESSARDTSVLSTKLAAVKKQLVNVTNAIVAAGHSTVLIAKLTELERSQSALEAELMAVPNVQVELPPIDPEEIQRLIDAFFASLPTILNDPLPGDQATWFPVIRKMIDKITVRPTDAGPEVTMHTSPIGLFDAIGLVNHLGDPGYLALAGGQSVGGCGGQI